MCRLGWCEVTRAPARVVQGNYSDVLVHLSNIYSDLRGDTSGVKNEDSAQGFVRSTTKYWVRTQDATSVKHHILQHLPVSLFKKDNVSLQPACEPLWTPLASPPLVISLLTCSIPDAARCDLVS